MSRPAAVDAGILPGAEAFDFGQGRDAVLFLHGWTSSPRELRFLAQAAAARGYRCRGPLLGGHGRRSADLRGWTWPRYLEQAAAEWAALKAAHHQVFLCGLSFGGQLALHLAARHPVDGLVLIAPFLRPAGKVLGLLPQAWLIPFLPASLPPIRKGPPGPIADPAGAAGHIAYPEMPVPELRSVVAGGRAVTPLLPRASAPALIFHAVGDRTSDFGASLGLIRRLGGADKTLVAFNRGNHVLTLDYDRERIETTALAWLDAHR